MISLLTGLNLLFVLLLNLFKKYYLLISDIKILSLMF